MLITFHIENSKGVENQQLVDIGKASGFASQLEKMGVKYRLGKTVH